MQNFPLVGCIQDVYKRQVLYVSGSLARRTSCADVPPGVVLSTRSGAVRRCSRSRQTAVSYTHLDVYKRQYMDYLVNLEENVSAQLPDARPISRWREFGLQKGVLRICLLYTSRCV